MRSTSSSSSSASRSPEPRRPEAAISRARGAGRLSGRPWWPQPRSSSSETSGRLVPAATFAILLALFVGLDGRLSPLDGQRPADRPRARTRPRVRRRRRRRARAATQPAHSDGRRPGRFGRQCARRGSSPGCSRTTTGSTSTPAYRLARSARLLERDGRARRDRDGARARMSRATRRSRVLRALASAAPVVLVATLVFSASRGAAIALGGGPRRRARASSRTRAGSRSSPESPALPAAAAGGLLAARSHELTDAPSSLDAAAHEGHRLAVALLLLAGRRAASPRSRRRCRAEAPAATASPAARGRRTRRRGDRRRRAGRRRRSGGKAYDAFRAPTTFGQSGLRSHLFSLSGHDRSTYWRVALDDYRDHPALGSGAEPTTCTGHGTGRSGPGRATRTACTSRRSPSWGRSASCAAARGARRRRFSRSARRAAGHSCRRSPGRTRCISCMPPPTGTGSCRRSPSPRWFAGRCSRSRTNAAPASVRGRSSLRSPSVSRRQRSWSSTAPMRPRRRMWHSTTAATGRPFGAAARASRWAPWSAEPWQARGTRMRSRRWGTSPPPSAAPARPSPRTRARLDRLVPARSI